MGTVGDCFDNAMCESFFASLECELLWQNLFRSRQEAKVGSSTPDAEFAWDEVIRPIALIALSTGFQLVSTDASAAASAQLSSWHRSLVGFSKENIEERLG
jgi:transposase InsO family protein